MQSTICFIFLSFAVVTQLFAESCWQSAAERYGIHETILRAIAVTESSMNPQAINHNTNGSVDVGLMQINSQWFSRLSEKGVQSNDLWNPCTNIHVGAWILAKEIRRFGYGWRAVGAYNVGPKKSVVHKLRRKRYAQKVYHNLVTLNPLYGGLHVYARTQW